MGRQIPTRPLPFPTPYLEHGFPAARRWVSPGRGGARGVSPVLRERGWPQGRRNVWGGVLLCWGDWPRGKRNTRGVAPAPWEEGVSPGGGETRGGFLCPTGGGGSAPGEEERGGSSPAPREGGFGPGGGACRLLSGGRGILGGGGCRGISPPTGTLFPLPSPQTPSPSPRPPSPASWHQAPNLQAPSHRTPSPAPLSPAQNQTLSRYLPLGLGGGPDCMVCLGCQVLAARLGPPLLAV